MQSEVFEQKLANQLVRNPKLRETEEIEAELERVSAILDRDLVADEAAAAADALEPIEPVSPPALSMLGLSRFERSWPWQRKAYVGGGLLCSFCGKVGHEFRFCPSRPNEKAPGERDASVETLLAMGQIDVLRYAGKTLSEAKAMVTELGEKLNASNPYKGSDAKTKQLRANIGFWKAIGANNTILSWIGYGVPLRFAEEPPRLEFKPYQSALDHAEFITAEMADHLKDGSFQKIDEKQAKLIHPLKVEPKRNGGLRMCVDSRMVNAYLARPEFSLENLQRNGAEVIGRDNLQFTTDLRKAYYSVEMDTEAQSYLCWRHNGAVIMALVMIFGLSIAPMCFHKIMREVVRFLRALGINVLNYMDDFLWSEKPENIAMLLQFVRWLLPRLGWAFNDKCEWEPAKTVLFLGLLADAERYEYRVPEDKIKRVAALVSMLKAKTDAGEPIEVKHLRSLTGYIVSMHLALPPARVWTRALYREQQQPRYIKVLRVSTEAREELAFWREHLLLVNGKPIRHPLHELVAKVDASETGWGVECGGERQAGPLPSAAIGLSSTKRELIGLRLAAASIIHRLRGKRVRFEMDSMAAVRNLVKGGGPKPDLVSEVKEWGSFCSLHGIDASYEWIPREQNATADELSKRDTHVWSVKPDVKKRLQQRWASGTDAQHTLWCNPPFNCIANEIKAAIANATRVVIVVPGWTAQSWWPTLMRLKVDMVQLGTANDAFEPIADKSKNGVTTPDWRFFAVLLDCRWLNLVPRCQLPEACVTQGP